MSATRQSSRFVAPRFVRLARLALPLLLVAGLGACASGSKPPEPMPLTPVVNILTVKQAWTQNIGAVPAWFQTATLPDAVVVASADGQVMRLNSATGQVVWSAKVTAGISAGTGSDGTFTAVVDKNNGLVSIGPKGQLLWRYQLPATVLTPPSVFDGRIIVQAADQRVFAFDAATGKRLWQADSRAASLLVQQAGGIVERNGVVMIGTGLGRIDAYDLDNGLPRWQATLARPRGVTEVERVVGITGQPALLGSVLCARAYQSAVGCVDADTGRMLWTRTANGYTALSMNDQEVVGTQANGDVQAYSATDGVPSWTNAQMKWRKLSAPLLVGRTVAVGDYQGYISFLSAKDGSIVGRVATDGSAIQSAPVVVGKTLVAVTAKGAVYAFVPD
ncbi:MAG: outer membrane protein assembly factor BamB [Thiomonas sp. 20-64-9]|uniref:outer membrane protein assembly factor BamB n=1 Tax=unclassified Thiomonas TaxID=2625466 RepID=UPI000BC7528B|nr:MULTISPECIES: outer membrane protein assembly factor BamB [unclassified Thiomonas]OYV31197.1 MAG: outer membrane protein assembly factor BamB [Thiomonas sp. 20-64-9]OZB72398.1 MAG: outer membrane protein assembly factor BamB [Thiomonas sp. 13-64-67]